MQKCPACGSRLRQGWRAPASSVTPRDLLAQQFNGPGRIHTVDEVSYDSPVARSFRDAWIGRLRLVLARLSGMALTVHLAPVPAAEPRPALRRVRWGGAVVGTSTFHLQRLQ